MIRPLPILAALIVAGLAAFVIVDLFGYVTAALADPGQTPPQPVSLEWLMSLKEVIDARL